MYACICRGVTDKDIVHAIKQGVTSVQQLSDSMGVGSHCGICQQHVSQLLADNPLELSA